MLRATALNVAMFVSYDTSKETVTQTLGSTANPFAIQCGSSMVSAIAIALCSLPFDNVKTKIQKMKPERDGRLPYTGVLDCFRKSVAQEGVRRLWAGLPAYYLKVGPHAIITLLAAERFKNLLGVNN